MNGPTHTRISRHWPRTEAGLTMVELVSTLAVALIGLSLAVPTVMGLNGERELSAVADRLTADMTLARTEAVRRGAPVTLCSSLDGATCSGSTDWAGGWILLANPVAGSDGVELIRVAPPAGSGLHLGGSHARVVYRPDGTSTAL